MNKEKSSSDPEVQISRAGKPRDRIFDCAQDLFHRRGIRGVGVEAIAEAAGTSKMALYRHFDSKDELIIEYLNYKGRKSDEIWAEIETQNPGDPAGQLYGFVDKAAIFIAGDERGCDLANAAVELTADDHPGRRIIEELKTEHRNRLASLCRRAGISQPEVLADTLTLLLEGARVSRQAAGSKGPSAKFTATAEAVIATFQSRTKGGPKSGAPKRTR